MPNTNPFEGSDQFDRILADMKSVRRLTPQEILRELPQSVIADMIERIGKTLWVVISKDGRSVVQDPATHLPFKHNNKKFAELVAKEVGGHAVTWAEALKVLTDKNKPND